MSMFKKPKKNFRTRRADDEFCDEDDDDNDVMIIEPPRSPSVSDSIPAKKVKKKKKDKSRDCEVLPKSSSTLSFDGDEDVDQEVFQIKKSSHSRRIAKMIKREHKREKEEEMAKQDSLIPVPGAYSAENIQKLRQEQEGLNGIGSVIDMEFGSDIEKENNGDNDENSQDRPKFGLDDDDSVSEPPQNDDDPLKSNSFREMIAGGQIPDASMIHLARKRRQLARERGDDFIPIEENEHSKSGSRLIREEDHDHSDDEGDRLQFTVDHREHEMRIIQNTILEAEQGSHSEGSDQEGEWEKQQIRKGVQAGSTNQTDIDEVTKQYQQYYFGASQTAPTPTTYNGNGQPIVITRTAPPKNLPSINVSDIKKRLTDRLENLVSTHRAHLHERDDISSRMENCDIGSKPELKEGLEDRYRFYHEMRGYVGDLIECLSEKVVSINYLDRCMMSQWQQRAEKIVQRRQQDVKDEAYENTPKKPGVAIEDPDENILVREARQRRAAERVARRSRRRRTRESKMISDHCEGLSTDDEENKSETIKLNTERDHVTTQVHTMFEDVVDEFHKLDLIKSRFEEWKNKQSDSYNEAYIGLCLPKLFTPYIKLQLILWNPMEDNCPNYEETSWYESLMFYSYKEGVVPSTDDIDLKLMPNIIEKILIPKLSALLETVWDPMSSSQTRRLCCLVKSLAHNYPTVTADSKYTQSLIQAIVERLKKSLEDDVFIPLYSKQILENRSSPGAQFFHRQFWSAYKLLSNILMWQSILSDPTLQKLGLACLLNRYMILALSMSSVNSDTLFKCHNIVSVIPKEWFSNLDGASTIPLMESFCRYLVGAATMLQKTAPNDKDCKVIAKEGVKQIRKMLITLHAADHAASLAT